MADSEHHARFCGQCGTPLPEGDPQFCIECGHQLGQRKRGEVVKASPAYTSTGPTVRLANASGEQAVVGGTVRLPSSGAVPPGLWMSPNPPSPADIVALYVPLHAVVGGWSATTSDGWKKVGQERADTETTRDRVSFTVQRDWFPAAGAAGGLTLRARIWASSLAQEGRTRRGFRYRIGADPPMQVEEAWWIKGQHAHRDLPVPQIQLMAPPRVKRISDYDEPIQRMNAREADTWARKGVVPGLFRLLDTSQQRTVVGRGLELIEVSSGVLGKLTTLTTAQLYRVQMRNPLNCTRETWATLLTRMRAEADGLGLAMESDAVIEWWLERQGYDGAIFERGAHNRGNARLLIAFRRAQLVEVLR